MFYVYILRCKDNSLYIGLTMDIESRLGQHRERKVKWTMSRLPVELVYSEKFENREIARRREKELKTGFGRKWLKRHFG